MSGLEALAAFGLACNVMQVIGFVLDGAHVVKTVYNSGCLDENLTERTLHLTKGLQSLEQSLTACPKTSNKDERELLEIARGCLGAASTLKAEMDKIAGDDSKRKRTAAVPGPRESTAASNLVIAIVLNASHTPRLGKYPHLREQDLTQRDIRRFAFDRLSNVNIPGDPGFRDRLVTRICDKADGVFLWAAIVSENIRTGFLQRDSRYELEVRLKTLPGDLNSLYKAMWKRLNDSEAIYKHDAACYFNLLLDYMNDDLPFGRSDIVLFALAGLSLRADVPDKEEWIDPEVFNNVCQLTIVRLRTRSAGMMEVFDDGAVAFVHRSAVEFLTGTAEGQHIRSADESSHETRLLHLFLAHLDGIKLALFHKTPDDEETSDAHFSSLNQARQFY
ncbi:vegetative incompatibility protein HET-E-1 [Ophiocordyceps camponoti-floridani]|uniref:Vegetative incompatibility protein HET-E-1 n=1 Tax=Ophiocordyceps camponoti-floridani TaxID=2030778 RepID=A0A8H4VCY0_9HYPO|nr:vegetative incompatibility protein HET-E-1 [Ophiocordyceps camponoti-floridani]